MQFHDFITEVENDLSDNKSCDNGNGCDEDHIECNKSIGNNDFFFLIIWKCILNLVNQKMVINIVRMNILKIIMNEMNLLKMMLHLVNVKMKSLRFVI